MKFEQIYRKIIHNNPNLGRIIFENKQTLTDIIEESVLPSPYMLINDILQKLNENESDIRIIYEYNQLIKLADKDWKFYDQLINLPKDVKLTIIKCSDVDLNKYISFNGVDLIQGDGCEFYDGKNWKEEYIWIDSKFSDSVDDLHKLLKHELGHVWTSLFGFNDQKFKQGITYFKLQFPNKFNNIQYQVFHSLYRDRLDLLKQDFNYLFVDKDNQGNWELSTHIDEIIELLVDDYLEYYLDKLSPDQYLNNIISKIRYSKIALLSDLNILKHYKYNIPYQTNSNVSYMKNIIRRLFLILSFGNENIVNYFKQYCIEEFKGEK